MFEKLKIPIVGAIVAAVSIALVRLGNPANMGFCIACFLRDSAGALGLHSAATVQYMRPEIIGIILGAFIASIARKEFSPKGGSAPATRFILGFSMMTGALIFLGCPLRMVLRIAGGDWNAIVGLFGFAAGILIGAFFLKKGYSLKRTYDVSKTDGFVLPVIALILFCIPLIVPSVLAFSKEGPGSLHAPIWAALAAGLVLGVLGFISRLCFAAGIRDSVLFKNFTMLGGFITMIIVAAIGNLAFGSFKPGFAGQPIAHTDGLWNFLGMTLVGLSAVLLGGCPFRQLVLAASGNSDSIVAVFGMVTGAALAHNFRMASSAAGTTANGKAGFAIMFTIAIVIAVYNTFGKGKEGAKA
jgi:YedE family putative selenium metabolism protein